MQSETDKRRKFVSVARDLNPALSIRKASAKSPAIDPEQVQDDPVLIPMKSGDLEPKTYVTSNEE